MQKLVADMVSPFGPTPPDVALEVPPLVRVLAQLRFPERTSVVQAEFIGPFQEAARHRYPILRKTREVGLLITPEGPATAPQTGVIWRLTDKEGIWQLSLAPTFLALETKRYTGRLDFLARFEEGLGFLNAIGTPEIYDRFGLRYVNRIACDDPRELNGLVREEVLGFVARDDVAGGPGKIEHSISQHRFAFPEGALQVRVGLLPANASLDPTTEPATEPSWLLDLDMAAVGPADYETSNIVKLAEQFHARIYGVFRWAVTEEFLRQRGGHI